jgi:hypothetical protein
MINGEVAAKCCLHPRPQLVYCFSLHSNLTNAQFPFLVMILMAIQCRKCMYRLASWCLKESHTIRANFFLVFRMCFVSPIILICQKRWARRQSNMAFSPYLNHFSGNHQTLLSSFLKGFWTSQSQNTPYICYITKILQDLHNLTILFFLSSKNKQYLLLSKLTLDIILHGDCFFFSLNSNSNSMRGIF